MAISKKRKWLKRLGIFFLLGFLALNGVAFMHAYKFTHFQGQKEKPSSTGVSGLEIAKILFLGMDVPRPENRVVPRRNYEEVVLKNENGKLHGWWMEPDSAIGTVALFHGYGGTKSGLLYNAEYFLAEGYNVLLLDQSGSGDSDGSTCEIGVKEALDVKSGFDYVKDKSQGPVFLFGASMGAASVMRAVAKEDVEPDAIILECPFGSLLSAARSRFENMGVPSAVFAELLVFWGGVQNGFNAFKHSPTSYAKEIDIPVLLIWGEHDDRVRDYETNGIYENLASKEKELLVLPNSGHNGMMLSDSEKWFASVEAFMAKKH